MYRLSFLTLSLCVLATAAPAQDVDFREELRFAEGLRARGDNELARDVIQRLRKIVPADMAKELALEEAKTSLRIASEVPETGRRLKLYREAGVEFQKFIDENPGHARIAEANLDVARVLNLTGRTELNEALLAADRKTRTDKAKQARATLAQAALKLTAAGKALEETKEKLPDPEGITDAKKKKEALAQHAQLDREIKETIIDRGLNLYDQAETYLGEANEAVSKLLTTAKTVLDPVATGAPTDPATWKARAWSARIIHRITSRDEARARYQDIIDRNTETSVTTEGIRLAKYFRMLLFREQPPDELKKPGDLNKQLILVGENWRLRYPRHLKTPEGCGVTFLLAQTYVAEGARNKLVFDKNNAAARKLLTELERSENEFTDRARRMKIQSLIRSGKMNLPIEKLTTFEDCYLRAQYEDYQQSVDPLEETRKQLKELPAPDAVDAKERPALAIERKRLEGELAALNKEGEIDRRRKQHRENVAKALDRALSAPDVKTMPANNLDLENARSWASYVAFTGERYEDAIKYGEAFARQSPRSGQAGRSAVYALQAYHALLAKSKQGSDAEAELRSRQLSLAQYAEDRWPGEFAGDVAIHTIALYMLREDNVREAIKKLTLLSPGYADYVRTRKLLADAAMKADGDKLEPIDGDRPGDYRKRAFLALESMPASALGADTGSNYNYVSGKVMLASELYRYRRYPAMDQLATSLLGQLAKINFSDDQEKDVAARNDFRLRLTALKLYARYGQADAAMQANDYAKVTELLDPLIDAVLKEKDSPEQEVLKNDQQLTPRLLPMALRANLLLGKIDRTDAVLDALAKVSADDAGATTVLRQVAGMIRSQVDELKKKGDKDGLAKAIKGYTAILDKQIAKNKGEMKPDFLRMLADCYSSMGEHSKAADRLGKIAVPEKVKAGSPEEVQLKGTQLLLVRELRLSGTKEDLKKAREVMDKMRGSDKMPGWARRNVDALMEHAKLLQMEEQWKEAFIVWRPIVVQLSKQAANADDRLREKYFDCYFNLLLSGLKKATKEERDKAVETTAQQIVSFEKSWEDFGNEASKKRFTELLDAEPAVKAKYLALKAKK